MSLYVFRGVHKLENNFHLEKTLKWPGRRGECTFHCFFCGLLREVEYHVGDITYILKLKGFDGVLRVFSKQISADDIIF